MLPGVQFPLFNLNVCILSFFRVLHTCRPLCTSYALQHCTCSLGACLLHQLTSSPVTLNLDPHKIRSARNWFFKTTVKYLDLPWKIRSTCRLATCAHPTCQKLSQVYPIGLRWQLRHTKTQGNAQIQLAETLVGTSCRKATPAGH